MEVVYSCIKWIICCEPQQCLVHGIPTVDSISSGLHWVYGIWLLDCEGNGSYCLVLQIDHQVRRHLGQLFTPLHGAMSVNVIWCQALVIAQDGDYHKSGLLEHLTLCCKRRGLDVMEQNRGLSGWQVCDWCIQYHLCSTYHAWHTLASTGMPLVGKVPKKMSHIKVHKWVVKWHARNVCVRVVKGLHEPYQSLSSAYMDDLISLEAPLKY